MKHKVVVDIETIGAQKAVDGLAKRLSDGLAGAAKSAAGALKGLDGEFQSISAGGRAAERVVRQWASLSAAAQPLGESLSALKSRLWDVAGAFMNVLAPVAEALIPVFDAVCSAAIRLLNTLALLTARIFGSGGGLVQASGDADGYAKSLGGVAKSARAARGELAAFDKLDVLGSQSSGGSGGAGGGGGGTGIEIGADLQVPENLLGLLAKLLDAARAVADYFLQYFAPAIKAWGDAFEALREPVLGALEAIKRGLTHLWEEGLKPLGEYLLTDFIPSIVNAFSETFAPIFTDILSAVIRQFGLDFEFMCSLAVRAIHDMLLPALEGLKNRVLDMLAGITAAWETYGAAILAHWESFKEKLRVLIDTLYTEVLLPLFTKLSELLDTLWKEHIKPLWDNLMLFFGALGETVMAFLDEVLLPFITWLVETFGPSFVGVIEWIAGVFSKFVGGALDAVSGLLTALRGLLEFLTGVFTGDWRRAWNGIATIIYGVWSGIQGFIHGIVNAIIGLVNGLIAGVAMGVNAVVDALNTIQVDIPDWVPGYGGKRFGFTLPNVTAPQIPMLAAGAVIPPNRAFLAVLGDQTHGNNIETPEGLLRKLLREELRAQGGGDVNIRFTGSLSQLARVLKPEIEREDKRVGAGLVMGA